MSKPHEPPLPEPELHKPEPFFEPDPAAPGIPPIPVPAPPSNFDGQDWGIKGNEFARFHLAGDCDVRIYYPAPGQREISVEVITGSEHGLDGTDTRKRTILRLPKARARAFASAIMGVAAEL